MKRNTIYKYNIYSTFSMKRILALFSFMIYTEASKQDMAIANDTAVANANAPVDKLALTVVGGVALAITGVTYKVTNNAAKKELEAQSSAKAAELSAEKLAWEKESKKKDGRG